MRIAARLCAVLLAVGWGASAAAQAPPVAVEPGLSLVALATAPARGGAKLTVSTPSFAAGADIPFEFTTYRTNMFPGLTWSAGPAGVQSYAVVLQDGDYLSAGVPLLHWGMFNIPAGTTSLAAGATNPLPAGSSNLRGRAFSGPSTPAGPKHRYHFQVFALDSRLSLDPTAATYDQLIAAMKDHVLASGETIGLGQVDPTAPPPAPPAGGAPPPPR
ncbi:MAG: hypothetical protein JWM33_3011 [Caulobacteraceae bacterium]|nr:hypothetical protein [Caulobacteraceae bacterium]